MESSSRKVVLITGCSSGIGRATAERLVRRDHVVYASARRRESVEDLQQWASRAGDNARACHLNVTDRSTGAAAVARILDECGRLDVLVNNAGYGQAGAVEDVTVEQWRQQFEVNLFGLIALTQEVLPPMRAAGSGRVVNVSSVVAHVTPPFLSAYCATKHALEATSNALRVEVARWGIHVALVEPGPIETAFRENVTEPEGETEQIARSPYADAYRILAAPQPEWRRRGTLSADHVAVAIQHAVEARRPRTRYRVTFVAKWAPALAFLLGDRLLDRVAVRSYRLQRFCRRVRRESRHGVR